MRTMKQKEIIRTPICSKQTKFKSCELCYGHKNCCKQFDTKHKVIYVPSDYSDWNDLEIQIWNYRQQDCFIRLVIDGNIPLSILWAASYDHRNVLQMNIDLHNPPEDWIANLAHASERCGLFFVIMLHPIIPGVIKVQNVLQVIDSIRSIPHCLIMLRFAEYLNNNELSNNEYMNVNG